MNKLKSYRYLISRRIVQLGILFLFFGGNYFGWTILKGNYSSGLVFNSIQLTDPYAVLQILFSGFMASTNLLIGAIIVLLLYGVLLGRIFCSWICPVNIVSDAAIYLAKKLGFESKLKFSRKTRYAVMILALLLSIILGFSAFEAISPIAILHRGVIFGIGAGWTIILALILFDIAATRNGWCGHLCPLGAFYSLVSRFAILKIKHSNDNCTNCNKCFDVCHEPQVLGIVGKQNGIIKSGECSSCARCIEVCDDKALNFSLTNSIKKQ